MNLLPYLLPLDNSLWITRLVIDSDAQALCAELEIIRSGWL
jgi:hypothetical protein